MGKLVGFRVVLAAAGIAAFAGCASPVLVAEFNGDSATVQSGGSGVTPETEAEARRICATAGRRSEYASSRRVHAPEYYVATYHHLFLCLEPTPDAAAA